MAVDLPADADDRSTELTEQPEQEDGINCSSSSKTIHHTSVSQETIACWLKKYPFLAVNFNTSVC
jgi:hypothetical protein